MTKGDNMGFILGFLLGLIAALGLIGFLIYWLCSRSDNIAIAKCLNGFAQALANRPKSPEPLVQGKNGEAAAEAGGTRKEKAGER